MSWTNDLASGIRQAFSDNFPCRVAVHTQTQAELGAIAARRMYPECDQSLVTFEVIPEREHDLIPVGTILVGHP